MDLLFHAPFVRGIFLADAERMSPWRSFLRVVQALRIRPGRDRYRDYAHRLADLEIHGTEFLTDVPEHVRELALKMIIRMPWQYWRYPQGASASDRRYLYESEADAAARAAAAPAAADPRFQLKQPGAMRGVIERR
jgi:hypothetical protein